MAMMQRVCVLGATGTIGRATVAALLRRGHEVVCLVRTPLDDTSGFAGADVRLVDVTDRAALVRDGYAGGRFDAVISCLASRTGQRDTLKDVRSERIGRHRVADLRVSDPRIVAQSLGPSREEQVVRRGDLMPRLPPRRAA